MAGDATHYAMFRVEVGWPFSITVVEGCYWHLVGGGPVYQTSCNGGQLRIVPPKIQQCAL